MLGANHVGEHLLGLVDLGAGDLHPLAMEQGAKVSPQILRFVESEGRRAPRGRQG